MDDDPTIMELEGPLVPRKKPLLVVEENNEGAYEDLGDIPMTSPTKQMLVKEEPVLVVEEPKREEALDTPPPVDHSIGLSHSTPIFLPSPIMMIEPIFNSTPSPMSQVDCGTPTRALEQEESTTSFDTDVKPDETMEDDSVQVAVDDTMEEEDDASTSAQQWEGEFSEITAVRTLRDVNEELDDLADDTIDVNDETILSTMAILDGDDVPSLFEPLEVDADDDDSLLRASPLPDDDEENKVIGQTARKLDSQVIIEAGVGFSSIMIAAGLAIEEAVCGPSDAGVEDREGEYDAMEDEGTEVTEDDGILDDKMEEHRHLDDDDLQQPHVFVMPQGGLHSRSRVIENENYQETLGDVLFDGVISIGLGVIAVGAAVASSFDPPVEVVSEKERYSSQDYPSEELLQDQEHDLPSEHFTVDTRRRYSDEYPSKKIHPVAMRTVSSDDGDDDDEECSLERGDMSSFTSDVASPIGISRSVDDFEPSQERQVVESDHPRAALLARDSSAGHVDYLIARAQLHEELNSLFREVEEFENTTGRDDDYIADYGPPPSMSATIPIALEKDATNDVVSEDVEDIDDAEVYSSLIVDNRKEQNTPSRLLTTFGIVAGSTAVATGTYTANGEYEDPEIAIKAADSRNKVSKPFESDFDEGHIIVAPKTSLDEDPSMNEDQNGTNMSRPLPLRAKPEEQVVDTENPIALQFGPSGVYETDLGKTNDMNMSRDMMDVTESEILPALSPETCKVVGYEQPQDCGTTSSITRFGEHSKSKKRYIFIGIIALIIFLILLLSIGFGTGAFGENNSSGAEGVATGVPTPAPTQERSAAFATLFSFLMFDGGVSLNNTTSPEAMSYNWIVNHDPLKLDPNDLSSQNQVQIAQRYGLATLYFNRATTPWKNETNWLGPDECEWYGITCNENGEVVGINMINNNMTGTLSLEIAMLTNLIELNLSINHLEGSLPWSIDTIASLSVLALSYNSFSGDLSAIDFSKMDRLTLFDVDRNSFTGEFPASMYQIKSLKVLSMDKNNLTGSLTTAIGNLVELERFSLADNDLEGVLPSQLGLLDKLQILGLSQNGFVGTIPTQVGAMSVLFSLDLGSNMLVGPIPSELGKLASLKQLALFDNALTRSIPTSIGNLTKLTDLKLNKNKLTGTIPFEVGNILLLKRFRFEYNSLWGQIPDLITNLVHLEILYCGDNSLSGTIPGNIGNMKALQEFQCFRNRITKARRPGITGTIPRSVGFLTNLQIFMVFQNGLSGTLPSDMGQMASLARLDVELNFLNGTVPSELGNLGNLTILQIGGNRFVDPLPTELCDLNLTVYTVDCNMTCTCCEQCGARPEVNRFQ